jgi:Na+-translocating ferredoxin:NAD+ oxidoreductase RnfG subunit
VRNNQWVWLPLAAISTSVYATSYFTVEQAQQAIFPGEKLATAFVTLSDEQLLQIKKLSDGNVNGKEIKAWKAAGGGWFFVDEVLGKHEQITYALALNADGSIRKIEIMDYRESRGYEIRTPGWRKQFVGKTIRDPLQLNQDIGNISGATLSCKHITDGVKRLLAIYVVALK